jgi:hypothetical protein
MSKLEIEAKMWLRAGFVALFFAGLTPASAEDDGPPPYAPSAIDHVDPLLMPANPPSASAVVNSQPEFPWEGEPLGQASSRSDHKPNVTAASNK